MSTSWFFSELDLFNPTINNPMAECPWTRDVKFSPVSLGHQSTSFMRNKYAAQGSTNIQGMPWISDRGTITQEIDVDSERIITPVRPLGYSVTMTKIESASDDLTRVNTLQQKMDGLKEYYQFMSNQYTYIGSSDVGAEGLVNNSSVTASNVPNGGGGSPNWENKNPDEIILDLGNILTDFNNNTGNVLYPGKLLMPHSSYNYIAQTPRSTNSDTSILDWFLKNNVSSRQGVSFSIDPVNYLETAGAGGTKRMVAYINDQKYLRLPLMQLTPIANEVIGIKMTRTFVWKYGELERVYPDAMIYRDDI